MAETPNDHDLLIRLDEKVGGVLEEIRLLRDGSDKRIGRLEDSKLDKEEFVSYKTDHEKDQEKILNDIDGAIGALSKTQTTQGAKLDRLGIIIAAIGGALAVLQFAIPFVFNYFIR